MAIKYIKSRFINCTLVNKFYLWKRSALKNLSVGVSNSSGRNNIGKISVWHKGGGIKQRYRNVLSSYPISNRSIQSISYICRIEYDPNRTGWIALVQCGTTFNYYLAARGMKLGDELCYGMLIPGNACELRKIPTGSLVFNLEPFPFTKTLYVRSAGTYATLVSKNITTQMAIIRFPSGLRKLFSLDCMAGLGCISNPSHKDVVLGKAGRSRWLNKRPTVRGIAMNPIDHPHGGGEGKTASGRHPITPWGKLTKGKKTRNSKKSLLYIILK